MVAFLLRMPAGIAGSITRPEETTTEPGILTAAGVSGTPTEYGLAVVLDATTKKYRLPTVGDVARDVRILTRPYPGGLAEFQGTLGVTPVDTIHVADVMRRGYINVKLRNGTAAKHGKVYVRKANASGGKIIGGFEATPDLGALAAVKTGTGNGTFVADVTTPVAAGAIEGVYTATFADATHIVLSDPNGIVLGTYVIGGSTGNAVTISDQIKGVVTQGSVVFIAGDSFAITVAFNTIELNANTEFTGPAYTDTTFGAITEVGFNI
jgi:hypothetical protein